MSGNGRAAVLLTLALDPGVPAPLFRQVYDGLRSAILAGRLGPGTRLPASRGLARELGVSRNTVLNAYEQLLAEGYLEGRLGSGTYVPQALPDDLLRAAPVPRDDRTASQAALAAGVEAPPLSGYRLAPGGRGGLLIGYAAYDIRPIRDGVRRLAEALRRG